MLDPSEIEQAAKGLLDYIRQKRMLKEKKINLNTKKNPAQQKIESTDQ